MDVISVCKKRLTNDNIWLPLTSVKDTQKFLLSELSIFKWIIVASNAKMNPLFLYKYYLMSLKIHSEEHSLTKFHFIEGRPTSAL